ncbi:MAG: hypothetical protein R3A10_06850 [Caldilineaceae bacterium]
MDIGDYLLQPLHQFAKGSSAQNTVAPELSGTMRRCESCHSIDATHEWLPYKDRHMETVSCESCHVPTLYAPAAEQVDWTVLTAAGEPRLGLRGVDGSLEDVTTLIEGYSPILLPRTRVDGDPTLAPHNLVSSWFWVYGDPARPVRLEDLRRVYLDGDGYRADVVAQLDDNGDGILQDDELALTADADVAFVATALAALGLENPRIQAEVQPYSVSHNVTHGDWATKERQACHGEDSRLAASSNWRATSRAASCPALSATPTPPPDDFIVTDDGQLMVRPATSDAGLYVLGHDRGRGWTGSARSSSC